ncbi:hypothetical protein AAC387_Pa07g3324 [Persea americana]
METGENPPETVRTVTPKALIHQKYGAKALYRTEEVKESVENECPGLVIPQKSKPLYRCCLELPEFSITSGTFTRKKDAEQSAAQMAIEKLGIQPMRNNLTVQERWDELVSRLSYLFTDEFLLSSHPLSSHFRAALQREGNLCGSVPISILAACDVKLINLCKSIDLKSELNPYFIISLIMNAARLSGSIRVSEGELWIWRLNPPSSEIMQTCSDGNSGSTEHVQMEAILIPNSMEKAVETVTLNISSKEYYLDVIAQKLGVMDCSRVLVSRTVGKASSEMRLYFPAPVDPSLVSDSSLELLSPANETVSRGTSFNARASYFSGQNIHGDVLLASVGYTWKSPDLYHEDVSLGTYYRMLIGRVPDGNYKLSREAILAADLPITFTTRSNWRGSLPRDLLCMFCRQHRLSEPVFSTESTDTLGPPSQMVKTSKRLKPSKSNGETEIGNGLIDAGDVESGIHSSFGCELKVLSKSQDVVIQYSTEDSCRKQSDAIQIASLKVLTWLKKYFEELDMPVEKLSSLGNDHGIYIDAQNFSKEFALCASVHSVPQKMVFRKCSSLGGLPCGDQSDAKQGHGANLFNVEGEDSGISPTTGSLACVSYMVSLSREGKYVGEPLESKDEFEFEIGTGAVIHQLESCVTQMSVNQATRFVTEMPSKDLVLAAAGEAAKDLSPLSLGCCLEYSVKLLRVTEPLEDRIEQALFSPPLSKQRVEYALRHINESHASTLVDFGCGSGSLLDSLLEHPTALEEIVGVDISRKGLTRAAKILHSKLSVASDPGMQYASIRSAVLYDGSITDFDSRLYGFDIGTCLEVIEHMQEDQACMFGDIALGVFCPRILIVSTPNYEYNPILQRNSPLNKDEDPEEKSQPQSFKFRNHDHKFEWTREQFNSWASNLASKHNYSVEFGGVGGTAGVEPGFASQIAVFRRNTQHQADKWAVKGDPVQPYEVIWEWTNSKSRSAV